MTPSLPSTHTGIILASEMSTVVLKGLRVLPKSLPAYYLCTSFPNLYNEFENFNTNFRIYCEKKSSQLFTSDLSPPIFTVSVKRCRVHALCPIITEQPLSMLMLSWESGHIQTMWWGEFLASAASQEFTLRMFWVEGKFKDHLVPLPWSQQGYFPPDQIAQNPVQPHTECFWATSVSASPPSL